MWHLFAQIKRNNYFNVRFELFCTTLSRHYHARHIFHLDILSEGGLSLLLILWCINISSLFLFYSCVSLLFAFVCCMCTFVCVFMCLRLPVCFITWIFFQKYCDALCHSPVKLRFFFCTRVPFVSLMQLFFHGCQFDRRFSCELSCHNGNWTLDMVKIHPYDTFTNLLTFIDWQHASHCYK